MNARGIDVSKYQAPGKINWDAVAAEHAFVIARATYGRSVDGSFLDHVAGAQTAGMRVGGYHFFRQTQPVDEQVNAFLDELDVAGCGPGWLPPAIDVERNDAYDGPMNPELYRVGVRAMLDACLTRYGSALVYVNPSDAATLGNPDWFRDQRVKLWIAHHGTQVPSTPNSVPWTFWQMTDKGRVAGYDGDIDLNQFCGPAERLPLLASTDPPTAPDTERPPVMTVDESHSIQISRLEDLAHTLSNGLLELSGKLDKVLAAVGSTNATLWTHERRLDKLEERPSNGAPHV